MATLGLHNASLSRNNVTLFCKLTFDIKAGSCLLLRGANGAGKTSVLRALTGLLTLDKGYVAWCGRNIVDDPIAFRRQLNYLGHSLALKSHLSVWENGYLMATQHDAAHVRQALVSAKISHIAESKVGALSAGQRQRLRLCQLILRQVPIWLLDEPFVALDEYARHWLVNLCQQHMAHGGIIILASHTDVALLLQPSEVITLKPPR